MNKGKWLLVFSCSLVAIFNSCKDNPGNLSPQVLPKNDLISAYQTDTTTIVTSMYLKDSVLTTLATNSMLGSFNDPIFGESKASIYAEVTPSGYPTIPWAVGPNKAIVDSTVLLLQLEPVAPYGNNDPQTFVVYRLANNIDSEYAYYSNNTIKLSSNTPIGETQLTPPNSATASNDTLRIKLSQDFTKYFANQVQFGNNWSTTFNSGVIQGVYITTQNPPQLPGQGGIVYVTLLSGFSFSGICVYYHYPLNDSVYSLNFPLGGIYYKYFNNFTHNYATSPIGASHPYGPRDSIAAGQLMYIQAMGGVVGRVNFPNFYKNWSKLGRVLINAAVLNLPVDQEYVSANYAPPQFLYALGTGSNWQPYELPDEEQGQSYYGGTYTATTNGAAYTFTITQYIQSIIDGKNDSDKGLYILPGNAAITAQRVVLYGAGTKHGSVPVNRAALTIYYTPLKKT